MSEAKRINHKDLTIAFLSGGTQNVLDEIKKHQPSDPGMMLRKASVALSHMGQDTQELERIIAEKFPPKSAGQRGRKPVSNGETRTFKVQDVNGQKFIRLPVSTMHLDKGDEINVKFNSSNEIVVSARRL